MSEATYETIVPVVEEVAIEDEDSNLADFALDILKALRDMENRKKEVDSASYVTITTQLWEALDDITLRLFVSYAKSEPIKLN
jgi:hypothetical protein